MFEETLVSRLENYIMKDYTYTFREVPFLQRRVDLVGYNIDIQKVIAIEAKIKNWRDAVYQARTCLLFSDEVFIALPKENAHRVNRDLLLDLGIGLISVGKNIKIDLDSRSSFQKHKFHWEWMVNLLNQMEDSRKRERRNEK